MNLPTFEELVREAYRLLGDAEDVLRSPWRGENPTDTELAALDEVRDHLAVARDTLTKMVDAPALLLSQH